MRRVWAALAALHLVAAPASAAEGWVFEGGRAGFAVNGEFRGLWFACAANGATLFVSTGNTRLQPGVDQTTVVTVDGTAFLQRMRAGDEPVLRRTLTRAELADLASRLAKGRAAEVSMPAGRFVLPLKGSGKAVQGFLAACP